MGLVVGLVLTLFISVVLGLGLLINQVLSPFPSGYRFSSEVKLV